MPDDIARRTLTTANVKSASRPFAIGQRPVKPFAIGQARPPASNPPAKPPQPAPRPAVKPVKAGLPKVEKPPPPPATPVYVPPPVPQTVTRDEDGFPIGWCFERASWNFHRSLWVQHDILLEIGEYGHIKRQCRPDGGGERLAHRVWRVTLHNGRQIVVGVHALPAIVLSDTGWEAWVELQQIKANARNAARLAEAEKMQKSEAIRVAEPTI